MSRPVTVAVVAALVLSSCATSYRPDAGHGGYAETALAADSYRVEFHGNRYTSQETAEQHLMRRCAELTLAAGCDGFVVETAEQTKARQEITLAEHYQRVSGTTVTYTNKCAGGSLLPDTMDVPEQTATIRVPVATATIRLYRGSPPDGAAEAHDARQLLAEVARK